MSKQQQKADPKTEATFKTFENLRNSTTVFNEFIKAATNYQKQAAKLSEAGKQLADAIQKVGVLHNGDLGQGITKLSDIVRQTENRRENIARCMGDDLINSLVRSQKPDEAEVSAFRSDYEKTRNNIRSQITKLEANTKKAGKSKGGPQALQLSIQQLNDKIKEAESIKAEKLRQILVMERKRYCSFLSLWTSTVNACADHHAEGAKFRENASLFTQLALSSNQLSNELEDLIKQQERTFVSIQNSDEIDNNYSYGSSWSSSYDSNTSYSPATPSYDSYGYNQQPAYGLGTATALYDYAGQHPDDLSFYTGEVITITQEDDGSGWLRGELNGAQGIFPTTYVQRN